MGERLKRVLVAYSTLSGCTTTIARRIGADLIAYDAKPLVASVEEMPVIHRDIDAVVFGSGMRMGKFHKEARDWLQSNSDVLSGLPLTFFSVGLRAASSQAGMLEQAERELDAAVSVVGDRHCSVRPAVLPGWKRTEGFSAMEKLALRVYPLEDGDYRDWNKVDAWVREVAPGLLGTGPRWGNYVQ